MIVGIHESAGDAGSKMNAMMSLGAKLASNKDRVLCEDKRLGTRTTVGELLEGLPEGSMVRNQTMIMMENTRQFIDNLEETSKLVNIGDFEKYAFPMVRAIFPNLAAHNLASVQPMLGPVSLVFYMKFLYARSKGKAVGGTDIIENPNQNYSSEDIDEEHIETGNGILTNFTGNLAFTPIKAGTVVLTTKSGGIALEITDDGNGNLIGDIGAGTNTVNYANGAYNFDTSGAVDANEPINAAYSFDMEGNTEVPDIDMQLTSSPVQARTRKLRTRWSLEAAQDLRNLHGLEAEVEQVAAISNELKFEIDREIIDNMKSIAVNSVTPFSKTPGGGISFTEHKLFFVDKLIEASNKIFSSTQRATGTWLICGINVASLIESLPGFVPSPRPKGTRAVYKCGVLNGQWEIWKDPNYGINDYLMGYQGDSMWEVGFIFAPYILAFTTATIMLDDFIGRKGMASRYGKKAIDGRFYCTGSVTA